MLHFIHLLGQWRRAMRTHPGADWVPRDTKSKGQPRVRLGRRFSSYVYFTRSPETLFHLQRIAPDESHSIYRSGSQMIYLGGYPLYLPRLLRIESPRISMRWALCTRRSRMPSASVGSPICSCHRETGSCEVRIVERTWSHPRRCPR